MTEPIVNAAQRQLIEGRIAEAINAFMRDINLRKWCVEQALTHCARHSDFKELAGMFETIYRFVASPPAASLLGFPAHNSLEGEPLKMPDA